MIVTLLLSGLAIDVALCFLCFRRFSADRLMRYAADVDQWQASIDRRVEECH